jgi:CRISPR/Cas system-associated exonuclease Cas4 (RecB family)
MPVIRASEIGEYVYCARAWWLRRVAGATPTGAARRMEGTRRHVRHGFGVAASRALLRAAIVLVLAAGLLLLVGSLF